MLRFVLLASDDGFCLLPIQSPIAIFELSRLSVPQSAARGTQRMLVRGSDLCLFFFGWRWRLAAREPGWLVISFNALSRKGIVRPMVRSRPFSRSIAVASLLVLHFARTAGLNMPSNDSYHVEVDRLHRFIVDWFTAKLEMNPEVLDVQCGSYFSNDFSMVPPQGASL